MAFLSKRENYFPYKYQNEIECNYMISMAEHIIIKIVLIEFDLEHDLNTAVTF